MEEYSRDDFIGLWLEYSLVQKQLKDMAEHLQEVLENHRVKYLRSEKLKNEVNGLTVFPLD